MQDFKKLEVWRKAHALTLHVYKVTQRFPADERFGLSSQIRRAASSIPANIAEGCGRDTPNNMRHFLQIAAGSASELEYHLILAHDLNFLPSADHVELDLRVNEVKRMLVGFLKRFNSDS